MRKVFVAGLAALVLTALLLPPAAWARRETVLGSLTVSNGADLKDKVVGFALISNPGLEKNIVQQMPPLTAPVFLDTEREDSSGPSGGPRIVRRHFETTVILTNLTTAPLDVDLTLRDANGAEIGAKSVAIPANGTVAVTVSEILAAPAP